VTTTIPSTIPLPLPTPATAPAATPPTPLPLPLPPGWTPPPAWVAARAAAARPRRPRWGRLAGWIGALLLLAIILVPMPASGTDLLAAATSARAAYRYDRALAFDARAAQQDPDDPRPHCQMGAVLALQQLYDQAVAAYTRCQALGDRGPAVWLALGTIAQTRGDLAGAERLWLRSAALGGDEARHQVGLLYERQARFDLAAAQWRALPASDPLAQEHIGLLALRTGDYATARNAFIAAQTLPGFDGQQAVDQGFVQLAAFGPQSAAGLTSVGVAFVQANLPTFARLPLTNALALAPDDGTAYAYLAWVDFLAGNTASAQAESTQALTLVPHDAFTLFVAAELAIAASQWTPAAALLDRALQADNKNAELWAERGRAALGVFDYLHAELSYANAANLGTDPAFTISYLSFYVRYRVGIDDGRAQLAAIQATQRWPDVAQAQDLAAQVFTLVGQPDLAYGAYQRANQDDPSDPAPYLSFAQSALAAGNDDLAVYDLRLVLALRPTGPLAARARALLAPLVTLDL
jgi:tetratricopeptide (TPR) repeat protein